MPSPKRHERVAGEIHAVLADALEALCAGVEQFEAVAGAAGVGGKRHQQQVGVAHLVGEGRHVPSLEFLLDDKLDDAIRMTSLLIRMEEEDKVRAAESSENEEETP